MAIERSARQRHGTPIGGSWGKLARMTSQKWTSPTSAASPPPWVVKQAPPEWLTERASAEAWPADGVETWRAALVELGAKELRLTSDIRGVTIDVDGTAQQTLNDDDATPLGSAIGRAVDRLRVKKKSEEGLSARRAAPPTETE
jgi:hypothetical protein